MCWPAGACQLFSWPLASVFLQNFTLPLEYFQGQCLLSLTQNRTEQSRTDRTFPGALSLHVTAWFCAPLSTVSCPADGCTCCASALPTLFFPVCNNIKCLLEIAIHVSVLLCSGNGYLSLVTGAVPLACLHLGSLLRAWCRLSISVDNLPTSCLFTAAQSIRGIS